MHPRDTARFARERLASASRLRRQRQRDATHSTFLPAPDTPDLLRSHLAVPDTGLVAADRAMLDALAQTAVDHRFDLLGSGPMVVRHGAVCPGLEGIAFPAGPAIMADPHGTWLFDRVPSASVEDARRIWELVDPGYVPIDWQLDFRSGYRWSEKTWSRDIQLVDVRGADAKLPWELARMQHLPRLALARLATRADDPSRARQFAREFRNEVLDFVATNPPRFGVNWTTTMDVAIRITNWLVAWDLFRVGGESFDDEFEAIFRRSVLEHGRHIAGNLEWRPLGRGNHYLADIVGLLFVAAWLPPGKESDHWRAFAGEELIREAERQLQPDGTGFEASTCYHRLATEMIVWGTALWSGVADGGAGLPDWLVERLARAGEFTIDVSKPNGRVVQIGDNDSGRFLQIIPAEPLDHRHLVALIGGLLGREDFASFGNKWALEGSLVRTLAGAGAREEPARQHAAEDVRLGVPEEAVSAAPIRLEIGLGPGSQAGLRALAYPDFGIYVLRSARVFLAIRAGSVGQDGVGGHAHNDQLAIELSVDGVDWIRDPGTYVYTPLPERRDAYRSVRAHYVPTINDNEQARLDEDLFRLGAPAVGQCLSFGPDGFRGELRLGPAVLRMSLVLGDDRITIEYAVGGATPDPRLAGGDWHALLAPLPFSPGYGELETRP
jgi:hypothetical protein